MKAVIGRTSLAVAAALLTEDDRVAAEVRRQYKWFVVDEFQDVSPIQAALLDLWLGGRHDLCVVGDPAQTIYSFAGANASFLTDFARHHPGTTSVELVRNYRSTPQVVAAANKLLAATSSAGVTLRAQRDAMVAGILCASVVHSTKTAHGGGSSMVFSSALNASASVRISSRDVTRTSAS